MKILGIGIDIIQNKRIRSLIKNKNFIRRTFGKNEVKFSNNISNKTNYFAKRFAAKEAVMKALKSSGFKQPTLFNSIEIRSGDDGQPIVELDFPCKGQFRVSISHTNDHAIASAIFISE